MRVAGLFAGIGGFELGLAASGHSTDLFCEIMPSARAVLQSRFPGIDIEEDITELATLPAAVDLICAGFPCQDLSQAGRTVGIGGKRSGLIAEVFRLLRRHPVPWLVVENVPFMLQLDGGRAMREIIDELERLGYAWAYRIVDTFSFGLPQRRERVYLVASNQGDPWDVLLADDNPIERPQTNIGNIAHGFYWTEGKKGLGWAPNAVPTLKNGSTIGIPSPPAVLMPDGRIVKPDIRDVERLQGFAADWTAPAEAVGRASLRWSLTGNAVSVPVATWVGARLEAPGAYDTSRDADFPKTEKLPRAARGAPGGIRFACKVSCDPVGVYPENLETFLRYPPVLLSSKATSGFYGRTQVAKLRFPEGFLPAVRRHLDVMNRIDAGALRVASRNRVERESVAA